MHACMHACTAAAALTPALRGGQQDCACRLVTKPDVGSGVLATSSQGTGRERYIAVMRTGAKPAAQQACYCRTTLLCASTEHSPWPQAAPGMIRMLLHTQLQPAAGADAQECLLAVLVGLGRHHSTGTVDTAAESEGGGQGEEPAEKFKAWWLWIWAKEAGLGLSRDEAAEMLHTSSWTPEVQALWERKSAQQKLVEAICSAAATGDVAALKVPT